MAPALTRSVLYGGLRLGLYEPSKYACNLAFGSSNVFFKIASGSFARAVATALTNPVEVLKVYDRIPAIQFKNNENVEIKQNDFIEYKRKGR